MKKRILYAILTLCILLAFAACNILVEGPNAESTGSSEMSDTEFLPDTLPETQPETESGPENSTGTEREETDVEPTETEMTEPETTEPETTEPETTEPETTEPETIEPETTEPETTEPETTEPETTEPETTEPETTEPEPTEPETTEPETTEPETTEPETTEPETTEPETTEPETTEPETTEPETTEPETTEPETTEPETTEPETTEPETTEPETTEPETTEPETTEPEETDPIYIELTNSEAMEAPDGSLVIVKGQVTYINIAWNESYENVSVTITDSEGVELYIYRLSSNVSLGDFVTITGTVGSFNGSKQIAEGAIAEVTGHEDIILEYPEKTIPDVLLSENGTLVSVRGTVKSIDTKWSSYYQNISVTITDEFGNELYIYRLTTNVQVGDCITVKGVVGTYKGSKQISEGATAEIIDHDDSVTAPETTEPETNEPPIETDPPAETYPPTETEPDIELGGSQLAEFEFGADSAPGHKDGSDMKEETSTFYFGSYSLKIENASKVYVNAFDAMGNSAIKLGTGKATGSFSFTVGGDVQSVIINIAGYKKNTAKVNINGTEYDITSSSDNGQYTQIIVDTSVVKTVEITTLTGGYRAMINSVIYCGAAVDIPDVPETTEPETTEPETTEPETTEPETTEPETTEPETSEPETTEPTETEPEGTPSLPQHAGTENDPYTVADALIVLGTLIPDTSNSVTSRVYVEGIVIDAGTLKNNKYISGITISDENGSSLTLYINTANPETNFDFDLYVGDKILLNGFLRTYIDKYGETVLEMGSSNGEYTYFTITEYGDVPGGGADSDEDETSGNTMPEQIYKPDNHQKNDDILHDAIKDYVANDPNNGNQLAIGLPAQGTYSALVIPVQFPNDSFTKSELSDLEIAFNGTAAQTGWHSVSSYYFESSFGKLNLSFDIYDPITMNKNSSSYETSDTGAEDILNYVLDMLDPTVDLSQYDTNDDGYIDAVYLIYSVPMDYENYDSNYWAFVTWHFSSDTYDNVAAHYYLFASIDFMYEDTEDSGSEYAIDGLKLNAVTYIHETGHLLGLDDYYDYNEGVGADRGLGNADMMDATVGDHNVYSKLMLGWVNPTVVTSSQQLTIGSSTESGQFIMILLDYNGTYFSEYLLIDLYTATGLNKLHAEQPDSLLYGDENDPDFAGAAYGARIYHVSSSINNPFNDDYYSFTDNNNSMSGISLIKLIEADGDKNYESDIFDGYRYASADDLWQSGDSLSASQPSYTRNNGDYINFDISFDSVTESGATITITFN